MLAAVEVYFAARPEASGARLGRHAPRLVRATPGRPAPGLPAAENSTQIRSAALAPAAIRAVADRAGVVAAATGFLLIPGTQSRK